MKPEVVSEIKICCVDDLLAAQREADQKFKDQLIFRGQGKSDAWRLQPKIFRTALPAVAEASLAHSFMLYAPSRYKNCPPRDDYASWLLLMQHYGYPTRLLDWTRSILVAAFFATWGENNVAFPSDPGAIWALDAGRLNEMMYEIPATTSIYHIAETTARWLVDGAFKRPKPQPAAKCVAVLGAELDLRLLVQHAAFTLHSDGTPIEELPGHEKFVRKFEIPAATKGNLLNELARLGVHESFLFPDLDHLAHHLQRTGRVTYGMQSPSSAPSDHHALQPPH